MDGPIHPRMRAAKRIIVAMLTLCAALQINEAAAARWHEARSAHFEIYTDLAAEEATALAADLEHFRWVLTQLATFELPAEPVPLRVYAFARRRDFQAAVEGERLAGIYRPGAHGGVAVIHHPKRKRWNADGRQVLLHEYVHHFLRANAGVQYPAWYEEGLAEYLSTFIVENDLGVIGAVPAGRALMLDRFEWLDSEVLIVEGMRYLPGDGFVRRGRIGGKPQVSQQPMLYAQGWLTVHFLLSDAELSGRVGAFLDRLNAGEAPELAFPEAFGMDFGAFHAALRNYYRADDLRFRGLRLPPEMLTPDVALTELTAWDREFWIAEAQMVTGYHPDADRMRRAFEAALESAPSPWRARIALDLVELANDLGETSRALELLAPALAETAPPARAVYEYARARAGDAAGNGSVRERLEAALERGPDDPALLAAYARTFLLDESTDSEAGLRAVGRLQKVMPQHPSILRYATMLYAELGRHDLALDAVDWEARFVRTEGEAESLEAFRARLERHLDLSERSEGRVPLRLAGD